MNFIFCIDVSGSMYNTLPKLREDLKNRFPTILTQNDTVSLIYFSGTNQVGTILSNFKIDDINKVTELQNVVDKWLVPQGLTAYTPPLKHAVNAAVINDLNILVFMTDGYNNDSSKASVFDALSDLEEIIDYKYFVEYGNYADTKFLQEMSAKCGGIHLTAKDFLQLQEVFAITSERHVPMQEVIVTNDKADKIYVFDDLGRLFIHPAIPDLPLIIKAPINTMYICSDNECEGTAEKLVCVLAALRRGEPIAVDTYLRKINNNELWQKWENAYGKQKQNELYDYIVNIIKDFDYDVPSNGIETSTETTSVFELLDYLYENKVFMSIPKYNKISLGKDTDVLTTAQKEHLATLTSKTDIDKYLAEIAPLKFIPDSNGEFCASSLTFNTSRANVSALVRTEGYIELPENTFGVTTINTHTYRNYTFIRDGILNIETIDVDKSIGDYIVQHNLYHLVVGETTRHYSLDLIKLPIVRREMVTRVYAEKLAADLLELTKVKALLKVLKTEATIHAPLFENDAFDEWLKSLGITPNGYSPVGATAVSQDTYMSVELKSALKSLSSLPAVSAVRTKIAEGKSLTLSDTLIANAINILDNCPETLITDLLETTNKRKHLLERAVARDVFSLIISKGWFCDKKDYDDNKVILPDTECTFTLIEKPVNI